MYLCNSNSVSKSTCQIHVVNKYLPYVKVLHILKIICLIFGHFNGQFYFGRQIRFSDLKIKLPSFYIPFLLSDRQLIVPMY